MLISKQQSLQNFSKIVASSSMNNPISTTKYLSICRNSDTFMLWGKHKNNPAQRRIFNRKYRLQNTYIQIYLYQITTVRVNVFLCNRALNVAVQCSHQRHQTSQQSPESYDRHPIQRQAKTRSEDILNAPLMAYNSSGLPLHHTVRSGREDVEKPFLSFAANHRNTIRQQNNTLKVRRCHAEEQGTGDKSMFK